MSQTATDNREQAIAGRIDRDVAANLPALRGEGNRLSLVPSTLLDAMEFAKVMATTNTGLPKHLRGNVGACLAVCYEAWETGLSPYAVANKSYLVNDRIAFEAQYIETKLIRSGILSRRPRLRYEGHGQTRKVFVTFWVKGEDEPFEYESPEIKDIKVQNSPLWKAEPDQQLAYYGKRAGARRYFSDALLGAYTPEEIAAGEADEAPRVTPTAEDRAARPQRGGSQHEPENVIDAEVEEAGDQPPPALEIQMPDGEVREFTDPADYGKTFSDTIQQLAKAGDRKAFDGFWDTNSGMFATLRQTPDGTREAEELTAEYRDLEADLTKREAEARKAAQREPSTQKPDPSTETAETTRAKPPASARSAPTAAEVKPEPWIFKPIGGRDKAVTLAGASEFAEAMLKVIKAEGYAPSRVSTFAFKLNEPGMKRLDKVDPDLHAQVLQACRDAGCEV